MKKALVIGASGGIGFGVAREFENRSVGVTRLSRSTDGLDICDPTSIQRVLGGIDDIFDAIFVATGTLAKGGRPEKALGQLDPKQMQDVFAVNAVGPALVLAQIERLLPREAPSYVGVLSARVGSIGDNKIGGWHSYRASKAALNQIVRGAAIEIARKRKMARVVALHPGTVETPFTANYQGHKMVAPDAAARDLCDVLLGVSPEQTGQFFDFAGKEVPW